MTCAPAAAAFAPVASVEPSSTTRISRQGAAPRSCETTSAMPSSSFNAGMTTDTDEGSAKQLLHDAVPGDEPGALEAGSSEAGRQLAIGVEFGDRRANRRRVGIADEPVLAVDD